MRITTALLGGCVIALSVAAIASAETNFTFSGTCSKPDFRQTVAANDMPHHFFAVTRGRCSTNDSIVGETGATGAWADEEEIKGDRTKARGVYTETFADGERMFYSYKQTVNTKNGAFVSGTGEFKTIRGTGKLVTIKAEGKCVFTPAPNDGAHFVCTGSYGTSFENGH